MQRRESSRKIGGRGCLLIGVTGVLLIVLTFGALFVGWKRRAAQRLDDQIQAMKAAGEPVTIADLGNYYRIDAATDCTALWLKGSTPLVASAFNTAAADLPIVGNGPDVPPLNQPWPQQAQAEKLLDDYAEQLALLHQAAEQGGAARYPVDFSRGFAMEIPHVQSLRAAARLLALEAHVRARRGDTQGAVDSMVAVTRLADSLAQEPIMISQLVRYALHMTAVQTMAELTPRMDLTDAQWQQLADAVHMEDPREGTRRAFRGERVIAMEALRDPAMMAEEAGPIFFLPRDDDAAFYLECTDKILQALDKPPAQAAAMAEQVEAHVKNTVGQSPVNRFLYAGSSLALPASSNVVGAALDAEARQLLAETMLAINRYRRRHDRWPQSLDQLVPELLPAVPKDPYDGLPLRYRLDDEGYTLHSVGHDGKDDGGDQQSRDDVVLRVPGA